MKVLYFLQTFKNLPQIIRLVRTIKRSSPNAAVLISHNGESFMIDPSIFCDLEDVYVMHVSKINRADFALMQAYLDGIAQAHALKIEFDWVVNITGQCYPTRPLAEFEHVLATTPHAGFMEYCEVFVPSAQNPWDRFEASRQFQYEYHWRITDKDLPYALRKALSIPRRIINNSQPFIRVDTSYGFQIGKRLPANILNENFKLYGGSYFKTLSRRAVDYLSTFAVSRKDITDYFRYMLIPDEVFPQTVLVNNPNFTFQTTPYYYMRWDGAQLRRPRILTLNDYQAILGPDIYFARKFDPAEDSCVLDLLDTRLFGTTERAQPLSAAV